MTQRQAGNRATRRLARRVEITDAEFRRRIRLGHGADQGVNASTVDVVTRQGQVLTLEAYLELLRREH